MRTRRESTTAAVAQSVVPMQAMAPISAVGETVLPTQQQRSLAQLKTAMVSLNKRHGAATTNEIINQIIQAISVGEDEKNSQYKPEYSDVLCNDELSNPPVPELARHSVKPTSPSGSVLRAVSEWFSFDEVSPLETAHFGPLFSMDEERWKMYLSLRNDIVRIYEDLLAQCSSSAEKGRIYLSSSDLRQRLHPKDDAAYVFEMWKFLTHIGVINRGRKDEVAIGVANSDGVDLKPVGGATKAVPPHNVSVSRPVAGTYTKITCSSCNRECKFFCYKPLPPPQETPEAVVAPLSMAEEAENPEDERDEDQVKEETMEEAEEKETYMCHDCTPAFFEKIPLRLFIDQDTRDRIIRGEFEEVNKDDLKSFIVVDNVNEKMDGDLNVESDGRKTVAHALMDRLMGGSKKRNASSVVVKDWDGYNTGMSGGSQVSANPLEILDPSMQEALTGAGQKIRGSVLIEQQVRNMVYGSSPIMPNNDEVEPVCPNSIDRAYRLVEEVFTRVAGRMDQPLPNYAPTSPLAIAKKTDPVHFELLCIVLRAALIAKELKEELLGRINLGRIESLAKERLDVKMQYRNHLSSMHVDADMQDVVASKSLDEIFKPVNGPNIKLASTSPKQLRLASL